MKKVCIIGLGWLGEKVGKHLRSEGVAVNGTCRSAEKKAALKEIFEEVAILEIGNLDEFDFQHSFIVATDCFLITIPPSNLENYALLIEELIERIESNNANASFIYTSSTSVYGSESRIVDELSSTIPNSENAKKIVAVEQYMLTHLGAKTTILRCGGLIGDKRHPVHYLAGREHLKKPNAAVNLIHYEDIARLVTQISQHPYAGNIINVCTPAHPSKKEYYQWAAKKLNLKPPSFNNEDISTDKTVISPALKQMNFQFKYKSPFNYPELNEK